MSIIILSSGKVYYEVKGVVYKSRRMALDALNGK